MMVRRINKNNWSSFSLRMDSRSSSFRKRRVLKSNVMTFLRFNKCIIKGTAVKGRSQKKNGVKVIIYLNKNVN